MRKRTIIATALLLIASFLFVANPASAAGSWDRPLPVTISGQPGKWWIEWPDGNPRPIQSQNIRTKFLQDGQVPGSAAWLNFWYRCVHTTSGQLTSGPNSSVAGWSVPAQGYIWDHGKVDCGADRILQRLEIQYNLNGQLSAIHTFTFAEAPPPEPKPVSSAGTCALTDRQLVSVAMSAGFTDHKLQTAVMVAIAESGGKSDAWNRNTNGSVDRGLWQINSIHPYDGERLLRDASYNAKAAWDISKQGMDWTPWVTYNNGKHAEFESRATAAIAAGGEAVEQGCASPSAIPSYGAPNPDYDPNNPDSGVDADCGLNPFCYIRSALVWAFKPGDNSMNKWQDIKTDAAVKPPVSIMIGGVGFIQSTIQHMEYATQDDNDCARVNAAPTLDPSNGSSCLVGFKDPTGRTQFNPLWNAAQVMNERREGAVAQQVVWGAMVFGIWLTVFWYCWQRISKSFGARDDQ